MAIREIIILPDKQLRLISKPVEKVTAAVPVIEVHLGAAQFLPLSWAETARTDSSVTPSTAWLRT